MVSDAIELGKAPLIDMWFSRYIYSTDQLLAKQHTTELDEMALYGDITRVLQGLAGQVNHHDAFDSGKYYKLSMAIMLLICET